MGNFIGNLYKAPGVLLNWVSGGDLNIQIAIIIVVAALFLSVMLWDILWGD